MSDAVSVKGLDKFDADVKGWFAAVEKATAEVAVGLAQEAFEQILETGPQFSGDFVANTRVSVGSPDTSFTPFAVNDSTRDPFKMGDSPAMNYARSHANWPTLALGQTIYISSTAKHDDYYSWKIENGQIKLRPENTGAFAVYSRAIRYVGHRYNHIGMVQMNILRSLGV